MFDTWGFIVLKVEDSQKEAHANLLKIMDAMMEYRGGYGYRNNTYSSFPGNLIRISLGTEENAYQLKQTFEKLSTYINLINEAHDYLLQGKINKTKYAAITKDINAFYLEQFTLMKEPEEKLHTESLVLGTEEDKKMESTHFSPFQELTQEAKVNSWVGLRQDDIDEKKNINEHQEILTEDTFEYWISKNTIQDEKIIIDVNKSESEGIFKEIKDMAVIEPGSIRGFLEEKKDLFEDPLMYTVIEKILNFEDVQRDTKLIEKLNTFKKDDPEKYDILIKKLLIISLEMKSMEFSGFFLKRMKVENVTENIETLARRNGLYVYAQTKDLIVLDENCVAISMIVSSERSCSVITRKVIKNP